MRVKTFSQSPRISAIDGGSVSGCHTLAARRKAARMSSVVASRETVSIRKKSSWSIHLARSTIDFFRARSALGGIDPGADEGGGPEEARGGAEAMRLGTGGEEMRGGGPEGGCDRAGGCEDIRPEAPGAIERLG